MQTIEDFRARIRGVAAEKFKRTIREIAESDGQVHASIRDTAADYGFQARKRAVTIVKEMVCAGVNREDAQGAVRNSPQRK